MSGEDAVVTGAALVAAPGIPLLLAIALLVPRLRPLAMRLVPWAALPALAGALTLPSGAELGLPWLLLGSRFGLDDTGRTFLLLSALVWLPSGLYARTWFARDDRRLRFFTYFLLTMAGNLGAAVAMDLLSFYLFFSLMSFSAYALIVHDGHLAAARAGRVFIYFTVFGELLVFAALVLMMARAAGGTGLPSENWIAGLALVGLGVKAGAVPVHAYLPLAYAAAPAPAAAVLAGALLNAGILGWMRFLPLGYSALPAWGVLCLLVGILAAFYGVVMGLGQADPKALLAYSSISQTGLMSVALGVALAVPPAAAVAIPALLIYALHHALAKATLFYGLGVASTNGDGRSRWLARAALVLPALALAGAPLTSGAVAKAALVSVVDVLPPAWSGALELLVSASAVATTLLMARFLFLTWPVMNDGEALSMEAWLPLAGLVAAVACAVWFWPPGQAAVALALKPAKLWASTWPVAAGALLAWETRAVSRHNGTGLTWHIPSGDILVVITRLASAAQRWWGGVTLRIYHRWLRTLETAERWVYRLARRVANLPLESHLQRWHSAGLLYVTAVLLLFLLSYIG